MFEGILMGNLGQDPDLRFTANGEAVCNISVAVNQNYKNRDGEKMQKTVWVRAAFWGERAETVNKYFHKGDSIIIHFNWAQAQGFLNRNNEPAASLEVTATRFTFVPGNKRDDGARDDGYDDAPYSKHEEETTEVDDIPF